MSSSFNHAVVIVGLPGHGKTTVARAEVLEHLKTHANGVALVHDPNRQFKDLCACYESVAAWRAAAAAAAAAKQPFPRGASIGGKASELTLAAIELGKRHNTAESTRVPVLVVYDESSLLDSSGSTYMGELDVQLLSNRRHWGIAPVYNVQKPTALQEGFYTMATRVYVFAQPSERRTRVLEDYLGLSDGELAELVGAQPFRYKLWCSGRGLVDGEARAA